MKNLTHIVVVLFALILGASISAQVIPNGGFEEWETNMFGGVQPVGWQAITNSSVISNINEVSGYGGGSAAEFLAVEIPGAGVIAPSLFSNPFPVDQSYTKMSGYLKGAPVDNDTLFILAGMYGGQSELVGAGVAYVSQEIADFTAFTVNIFYESKVAPDSCVITLIAGSVSNNGQANAGTTFAIDELSLSDVSGTSDLSPVFTEIGQPYPSPAYDHIKLPFELKQPDQIAVTVFDVTGKMIINQRPQIFSSGQNELNFDISNLTTGTYIISVLPSDGSATTRKFLVR